MFNNVGRKIKGLAKVCYWIIFVLYCLSAVGFLGGGIYQGMQLMKTDQTKGVLTILVAAFGALILVGLAFLFAWLSTVLLYGFGELIDQTMQINRKLGNDKPKMPPPPRGMMPPPPPEYAGAPMGAAAGSMATTQEMPVATQNCAKCGQEFPEETLMQVKTPDGMTHYVCHSCYEDLVGRT